MQLPKLRTLQSPSWPALIEKHLGSVKSESIFLKIMLFFVLKSQCSDSPLLKALWFCHCSTQHLRDLLLPSDKKSKLNWEPYVFMNLAHSLPSQPLP